MGGQWLWAPMSRGRPTRVTQSDSKRTQGESGTPEAPPELNISLEKVCFVIAKARELDVKVAPGEMDDASDEDMMQRILED